MNVLNLSDFSRCHIIAGFGNPLLDLSAVIQEKTILEKYNLKLDGQKEVNNEELSKILLSLESEGYSVTCGPGGCVQNTLRVIQALINCPSFCVFFGGIGDDEEGKLLETEVKRCGVVTRYAKQSAYSTGRVAALIHGENRSLVAHLGAAEKYCVEDFATPDNLKLMEGVFIVYIEGFFITHSFDVGLKVLNICRNIGVVFAFNISGAYVAEFYPKELLAMAMAADIILGNLGEFKALAKVMGLEYSNAEEMAVKLHSCLCKTNTLGSFKLTHMHQFGKTIVITQGKDPVICVYNDNRLITLEVPYLDPELIKDPTGAGDAFAAGFLVAFLQEKSVTECLAFGCTVAQETTQHIGVQLPKK